MAELIAVDGSRRDVFPADAIEGFTCDELYGLLQCRTVETVALPGGGWLILDEDGKGRQRFPNSDATKLLHGAGGAPDDYVAGPAIACSRAELL
jgi:hypothetical protein